MFVFGLVFQQVGREQMLLSSLEGFVRMCKSRCERKFKEETQSRGVRGPEKFLPCGRKEWWCGKAVFPTLEAFKIRYATSPASGQDSGNMGVIC